MRKWMLRLVLALLVMETVCACAETIELKTGGNLSGKVEEVRSEGALAYRVTTASGAVIEIADDQVAQVVESSSDADAYAARAIAAPDTALAQWILAKWCHEHRLKDESRRHAERVVELDPSHVEARKMLHFRHVDGQWLTREQMMAGRGMVWHEGKYRTRQEIAIRERTKRRKELEFQWSSDIRKWHRWLGDRRSERVQEAIANFSQVTDPFAGPPIVKLLEKERDLRLRRLLVGAAARIPHQATVNALVTLSLGDPDTELRYQCLEALLQSKRPGLTRSYVRALQSNDNRVVNRAGEALGSLGRTSAIGPLISALTTKHRRVSGGNSGGDTYSLDTASGGFSFGGGGPQVQEGDVRNPAVLTALVRLSGGQNYGYDSSLWRKWLATQARLVQVDLRRDE